MVKSSIILQMDGQDIGFVECFRAVGAFSHTIGNSVIQTCCTECVAASLECPILELFPTDGAKR